MLTLSQVSSGQLALAALVMAIAVGAWPADSGRRRLAALLCSSEAGERSGDARRFDVGDSARTVLGLMTIGAIGLLTAGVGGGIAALLLGGLVCQRGRMAGLRRAAETEHAALLDAVGVMTAELRAGAHPAIAAAAASGGTAGVHRVLAAVSVAARLGAAVPLLLERHAAGLPSVADDLRRLAAAWALAERHGVALGALMEAVQADLRARSRLTGQIKAQLAGPRATAAVLALLPVLGTALGQVVGANPLNVLSNTAVGQVLLVLGAGLICAGVLWSARIMTKACP